MIAGGAESTISPLGFGGFAAAWSSRNDDPATASRPGIRIVTASLGEGAGVMVLEEYDTPKRVAPRFMLKSWVSV